MWVSLNAMKCFIRGYPSRIILTNDHFQVVITIDTITRQIQDAKPNMVFPKPWVACNHPTFYNENLTIIYKITFSSSPFKLMSSAIFEFVPPTPWPYITSSFPHACPWL
jgi:hypothetical protein